MGGFNSHESLTQRVKEWRDAVSGMRVAELLEEILAVLEGRLAIDQNGMLHQPCDHSQGKFGLQRMCKTCGQSTERQYAPIGEAAAAKWAATLILSELNWRTSPQGTRYWDDVYRNLRKIAGLEP